jgi:hypothetical protein
MTPFLMRFTDSHSLLFESWPGSSAFQRLWVMDRAMWRSTFDGLPATSRRLKEPSVLFSHNNHWATLVRSNITSGTVIVALDKSEFLLIADYEKAD